MGKLLKVILAGTALAVPGMTGIAPARAQDAPPAASNGDIVVTAQRRSEKLVDVPMSIVALDAEALSQAGVSNTSDLTRVVPGVAMTFYGSFLQPAVRGITSTGANLGENSNVAMYIDGLYQPQQIATLIDLPDVQQIEVLKGPQGALYGQNATGGAILVSSLMPSFTATGKFSASYGNYNDVQLRGYASAPLSDTVAASLSASYQDRDGFRRQVVTRQRDLGLTAKVVRGKLLFKPSSSFNVTATAYYAERRDSSMYAGSAINGNSIGHAADLSGLLGPDLGPLFPIPATPDATKPGEFSTSPDVFTKIRSKGASFRAQLDLDAGTITSISGLTSNRIIYLSDVDGTAANIGEARAEPLTGRYFVHDTNFASRRFGAFEFLVGAFYLDGNETFGNNIFDIFVPTVPPSPKVLLAPLNQYGKVEKQIIAGYGEITVKPVEKLTLTAGGRYTKERQKTFSDTLNGVTLPEVVPYPGNPVTFSKFTPRITARYELTSDTNVYASWGKGFKSGVVNTTDYSLDPVKPETITAYEVGVKGRIAQTVRFGIAGFYYDYTNLQAVVYVPGKAYITQNAAAARVKGVDFDLSWEVTPELTLSGGGAFLDAKYTDFQNAAAFVSTGTGNLQITTDLSGARLLRAPKFSGNFSANYAIETSAGRIGAYGSLYHTSSYGMEPGNRIKQGAYTTFDGELSFVPSGIEGLRLVLWGKNLTNKAYLASTLTSTLGDVGSYAPPRTLGIRAEFGF